MNYEQLAFFNQQLAGMLKAGLPLEGSLRQISSSMRRGDLRNEIEQLQADLAQGVPFEQALQRRKLPDLYVAMLRAGIRSGDLPGLLTMAADHYTQTHSNWLRLKGLMVYPGLVLLTSLAVAVLLALIYTTMTRESAAAFGELFGRSSNLPVMLAGVWVPVVLIALSLIVFCSVIFIRSVRHAARWTLPGFREASLAQLASTIAVMLEHEADLGSALDVAVRNEGSGRVRRELMMWKQRLASGARQFHEIARPGRLVPPLFVWLVTGAGENWAQGFRRAAQAYDSRAKYRIELALYAALPVAILILAALIATEMTPIVQAFAKFMHSLGDGMDGSGP